MNPNSTSKTAAVVAAGASNILNKTNKLVNVTSHNYGYGEHVDQSQYTY